MAVAADGGEARLLCSLLRDGGEREGKTDTAPGEGIRTGARARQARFADVRRVATDVEKRRRLRRRVEQRTGEEVE